MEKNKTDYITLTQFLKIKGIASTGGQVKMILAETDIKVNGEPENRRGRKLYSGDVVTIEGTDYTIE